MKTKITLVDLGYELDNCFEPDKLAKQYVIELDVLDLPSLLHFTYYSNPYEHTISPFDEVDQPKADLVNRLKTEEPLDPSGSHPAYTRDVVIIMHNAGG